MPRKLMSRLADLLYPEWSVLLACLLVCAFCAPVVAPLVVAAMHAPTTAAAGH